MKKPIFNVIDLWDRYTIEVKQDTVIESNGWLKFYVKKEH